MTDDDKRQRPRAQVNRPGRIRVAGGPEAVMQLIEISETGATLFYSSPVPVNTDVELRFQLSVAAGKVPFVVTGQVRHYLEKGESHVIGVQFSKFTEGSSQSIQEFIRHKQ